MRSNEADATGLVANAFVSNKKGWNCRSYSNIFYLHNPFGQNKNSKCHLHINFCTFRNTPNTIHPSEGQIRARENSTTESRVVMTRKPLTRSKLPTKTTSTKYQYTHEENELLQLLQLYEQTTSVTFTSLLLKSSTKYSQVDFRLI